MLATISYVLDIGIALSIPIVLYIGYKKGTFSPIVWNFFLMGCIIDSTWEFGLYANQFSTNPVLLMLTPFPIHPILHPILHSLWDGGLFLGGYFLVLLLGKPPSFMRFRWSELGIVVLWGQVQELIVELSSTLVDAWTYSDKISWNPVLFEVGYGQVTLAPQVVWSFASIIFYFICIDKTKRSL